MASDRVGDGGWEPIGEFEGLEDVVSARPDVGPVPIALLDGALVQGPFKHVDGEGFPQIEVWEGEVNAATGGAGPQGRRLGCVGLVAWSTSPVELLAQFGPGVWVCVVRGMAGNIIRQRFQLLGTAAERRTLAHRRQTQEPPAEGGAAPAWLEALLKQQADQAELQRQATARRLEELEADLKRRQAADEARREAEVARREAEVERLRGELSQRRGGGGPGEHVQALRDWLEQAEEVKGILPQLGIGQAPTAPAPKGFTEEITGELVELLKGASNIKELLSLAGD